MATRPAASKRPSVAAEPTAKTPCKIHSLAVVSDKAQITGTHSVEIGENTVLHPYARIRAECGKIVIGKDCTVAENAVVGVGVGQGHVIIGDGVNVETGAVVEGASLGEGTVIEVGAKISTGAVLGKHCRISPFNIVKVDEVLPDFTVIYGNNQRRLDQTMDSNQEVLEAKTKGQEMHVQLLKRLIPNSAAKWV